MKILVYGLPESGKTYFSKHFKSVLNLGFYGGDNSIIHINADEVRAEANDWDFSDEGRKRQLNRMIEKAEYYENKGFIPLCDFVCPTNEYRKAFNADYEVWVNTIESSKYEDTNKVFEAPDIENWPDYIITEQREDFDVNVVAYDFGQKFLWDNQRRTTQMLGRYQPWHKGHQALLDRALEENEQVVILVRDMATDENNPFTAEEVKKNIIQNLALYAGEVKVQTVPNITHITYGRDVGYTIAQETFDADIEAISATNIRKENAGQ